MLGAREGEVKRHARTLGPSKGRTVKAGQHLQRFWPWGRTFLARKGTLGPMHRHSPTVRACLLLAALLQFTLPGAAAWADARLDGVAGPAHIESHSTDACGRIHPADCAFHRFLSAPLTVGRPVAFPIRDSARCTPAAAARGLRRAALHERLPASRAPPTLS